MTTPPLIHVVSGFVGEIKGERTFSKCPGTFRSPFSLLSFQTCNGPNRVKNNERFEMREYGHHEKRDNDLLWETGRGQPIVFSYASRLHT
jgi:hypothetical protein